MRIAFIAQPTDSLQPPVQGGSLALWIYHVARICARQGHTTFVLANHGGRFSDQVASHEGVQYVFTPTGVNQVLNRIGEAGLGSSGSPGTRRTFGAFWRDAGFAVAAARRTRALRCQVVHVMNYSQFVPIVRRIHPRAKIFLHMECEWLTQLDRAQVDKRLALVDRVIGCSEYITETIVRRFPHHAARCVTVPNAATIVDHYDRSATEPGYVLFVGRVSPEKGVHDLVAAFHLVLERFPAARLHIAGGIGSAPLEYLVGISDDPLVTQLKRFYEGNPRTGADLYGGRVKDAAGDELGKRIFLDGRVEHSEVAGYYRRAAILVNPSLSEAFGMSLVEAMMHRVPVVATRVGGMVNIVEHGRTGLLADPANPQALASAIGDLLENRARAERMGDAGRERALEKYSWDQTTAQLLECFESASGLQVASRPCLS